jgi:acetyl-CoA decarbonylase/synthase complex subunit gamma
VALTGLQINKLLPQTNCKECGSNTCLAFAMKLAAKKADLSQCPYASEQAVQVLGAASELPVRKLQFGADRSLVLGGETVLYRHEKTFCHQTLVAINVNDTDTEASIDAALADVAGYVLERVGEKLQVEMVSVTQRGEDTDAFVKLAAKAWRVTHKPLVLRSSRPQALIQAAEAVAGCGGVLASATEETLEPLCDAAKRYGYALAITAPDLNGIVALSTRLRENGFNDILLNFQTFSLAEQFQLNAIARRAAIKDDFRPLGYPLLHFIDAASSYDGTIEAITEILKYGGICVLPRFERAVLAPLLTLRLNIFTDPQKPIRMEPKVYAIGDPGPGAPIFVTTNFSLTYFIVSGEIENAGISAWLVVPECDGMSVLTAWAAGKFSGASIAKFIKEVELEKRVTRRDLVIPGYVAHISGELEEGLSGWKVLVGPQEAADIESFVTARMR